ncbi:hypothetical protein HanPSC8_Chr13g0564591 [Helianthus annuus]|nr:hypothetical protein HanPSC8_Chr13g0564591 [Helianthus annuus]
MIHSSNTKPGTAKRALEDPEVGERIRSTPAPITSPIKKLGTRDATIIIQLSITAIEPKRLRQ